MARVTVVAAAVSVAQLALGACMAPLLTGLIQWLKAKLQGRQGPSPLQPYRELRRLWGKSRFLPQPSTVVYQWAPSVVVAAVGSALLVLAAPGLPTVSPIGHDALLLVGLLVLARFAAAVAAWDTGSGFALMAAARDLMVAISVEALLILCLGLAALAAGSTDLRTMEEAAAGGAIWLSPAHWCALAAFALVAVAETGRQPIDNPDSHLELTMIHEGPLLEYAGRDLAYLQWAAGARHWIILVLGAELFLPHAGAPPERLLELMAWLVVALAGLAVTETLVAKMRLLRVPVFLGTGAGIATIGIVSWFVVGRT
jgi:formate hydrogenlyase subunit 4